jgi:hypothetical protein
MKNQITQSGSTKGGFLKRCLLLLAMVLMAAPVATFAQSSGRTLSRDQFAKLSEKDQQMFFMNPSNNISDLVNATPVQLKSRVEGAFYVRSEDFNSMSPERKAHLVRNTDNVYIVVPKGAAIPKNRIFESEFNKLSAEKRKAMLDSNDFEIIK